MQQRHRLVKLAGAKGTRIRVLSGRVWVSEEGSEKENLLTHGYTYVVEGLGSVFIEQEAVDRRGETAEIAISHPGELPAMWKRALGDS
jgi:hypothetical protein